MKPLAANSEPPDSLCRLEQPPAVRRWKELEVDQRLCVTIFCIELYYDLVTCMFLQM